MSDFGIICEMNPLHRGHQYLIDQAREMGAERIVCVMSGNAVQRGELAVADKYARAEALVRCGADLVLELPYPWSAASAESFAKGGISVLRHFADTVIFGSECGDLPRLQRAAAVAASAEFRRAYESALSDGKQAAAAYYELLRRSGAWELSSNDLLGVEYIRAAMTQFAPLDFLTVTRRGSAYADPSISEESELPSALAIRKLWREGEFLKAEKYLPEGSLEVFRRVTEQGYLTDEKELEGAILSFFRLCDPDTLICVAGAEGGIGNRLCEAARNAVTLEEMLARIRTKRYTDSHLRRTMLSCMTGVTAEDLQATPIYTTLLAANPRGRGLLAERRRTASFAVVTKPADADTNTRQYCLSQKLDGIFTLAAKEKRPAGAMLKATPYME